MIKKLHADLSFRTDIKRTDLLSQILGITTEHVLVDEWADNVNNSPARKCLHKIAELLSEILPKARALGAIPE